MRRSCSSMRTDSPTLPLDREDARSGICIRPPSPAATSIYDQRYAHNLEMRERARRDHHAPGRRRPGDARRDRALHQAVLDQHRPAQQPDGAQVRAEVHAGGAPPRRARGRARGRRFPLDERRNRSTAARRGCEPLFFDPAVDPMVTSKTPGAGKDILDGQREQPLRRRDDGGPRGIRGAVSAQLAAREAGRHARRGGLPRRRPVRRADLARSSATSRPRFRSRPRRWPTRSRR